MACATTSMPTRRSAGSSLDRPPLNVISLSRPQPDRRHHRGVRAGSGCARRRHPRRQRRLQLGRRREGVSARSSGTVCRTWPGTSRRRSAARKPVICAMEKYAMGVGFELAMSCDIRLATADTVLALPEVSLGQIPGSGGSQRVARIAGLTRAVDMMMLGRRIPAPEAHAWGLLTRVAADAAALDRMIAEMAAQLVGAVRTGAQDHQARAQHHLRHQPRGRHGGRGPRLREAARERGLSRGHRGVQRQAQAEVQMTFRSPDGAKRNPGSAPRHAAAASGSPDCASLHPGYEASPHSCRNTKVCRAHSSGFSTCSRWPVPGTKP